MHTLLTAPLQLSVNGKTMMFLPVPMTNGFPSRSLSASGGLWIRFLKSNGRRIELDEKDTSRVRAYMRQHGTEALTEDGNTAFTVAGYVLQECDPSVCGSPFEPA